MNKEHTDPKQAMQDALKALNHALLKLDNWTEETARNEAISVKAKLEKGPLPEEDLIDYLQQAAIDYLTHFKQAQVSETPPIEIHPREFSSECDIGYHERCREAWCKCGCPHVGRSK